MIYFQLISNLGHLLNHERGNSLLLRRESFQTRLASPEKTIVIFSCIYLTTTIEHKWGWIVQLFATSLEMNFSLKVTALEGFQTISGSLGDKTII